MGPRAKLGVRHAFCNKGLCQLARVIGTRAPISDPSIEGRVRNEHIPCHKSFSR